MDWKSLIIGAIAYAVISQVVHTAGAFIDMPYYTNPAYAAVWSPIMMPSQSAPPPEFYVLSIAAGLASGAVFCFGYSIVKKVLKQDKAFSAEKGWKTGAKYGLFVFALSAVGSLTMPLLFNIPFSLALSWAVQGLVALALSGAAAGMIYGRK